CKRVRRTNIGVYLILYSIISMIGSLLLVVNQSVQYFKPYPFRDNHELSEAFDCFLEKSGDQVTIVPMLIYRCEWVPTHATSASRGTTRWFYTAGKEFHPTLKTTLAD
ncbi:unnamed protein product, partial [Adineta steineri]